MERSLGLEGKISENEQYLYFTKHILLEGTKDNFISSCNKEAGSNKAGSMYLNQDMFSDLVVI